MRLWMTAYFELSPAWANAENIGPESDLLSSLLGCIEVEALLVKR